MLYGTPMQRILITLSLVLCASCGGTVSAGSDPGPGDDPDSGTASDAAPQHDAKEASVPVDGSGGPDAVVPPAGQRILFEGSYVNYAWQPSVSGFYVTGDGTVFAYDYYASAPPDSGHPYTEYGPGMTEQQITGKYGAASTAIGKLDAQELYERLGGVASARDGVLLMQSMCADAGDMRYVGYLYDPASSTYTLALLGANGDRAVKNTAPEAQQLVDWLKSLGAGASGGEFCEFLTRRCDLPLCPDANACPQGQVPTSDTPNGCAESCASPSLCEQVSSCEVCSAAKEACFRDQGGNSHCVRWVPGCPYGEVDCSCGGDSICAGGKAYCHGDQISGLSCVAP